MPTLALINNTASQGSITASPFTAKLNGQQIATVKSIAIHDKLGPDMVKDGVGGILLNGNPISFVGGMTTLGQSIMDMGITTAKMTGAEHYGLPECPMIEGTEIISSKVTLISEYAWNEFMELAKDVAEATFTLMLSETFGTDIGLYAYAELYREASEGKVKKPDIVVIKNRVIRYAAFHKHKQEIHVNEKLVRQATEEGDKHAMTLLYAALNEEFGHYIDWLLRNKYTEIGGDAALDEGAMYGYLMAGFDIFEIKEIAFGSASIDGSPYDLKIEFGDVHKELKKALKIYKQEIDNDDQTANYELFGAGLGNPDSGFYGHYGIEKILEFNEETKGTFTNEELNFTYLGNFLRDYSQILTPTFMGFDKEERAKVEAGFGNARAKEVLGMGRWLNPLKPGRDVLTYIVEVLAAHETMSHTDRAKIDFPSEKIYTTQGLANRAVKAGLAVANLPVELKLFHKNYIELDKEMVGVYRPEEHIDNPIAASVIDTEKEDYLHCPEGSNPEINALMV